MPGRLPAPSLFIGPPSRNASNTSIIPPAAGAGGSTPGVGPRAPPLSRQRSHRGVGGGERNDPFETTTTTPITPGGGGLGLGGAGLSTANIARKDQQPPLQPPAAGAATTPAVEAQQPSTDAIWAEMQNTLEEVELSALSGAHVFRPGHSSALDELRVAQIALAQAWARSEAEEESGDDDGDDDAADARRAIASRPLGASNVLAADRDQKLGGGVGAGAGTGRPRSGTETSVKSQLEQDTENDIQLARKRREANDRYFQRVNAGVLDVVAKLEEVAKAMKGVEQESKEIWGDGESIDTGSFVSK
ncbi:hypothetical protein SLS56_005369 [Neofusicoccum ribis]|uniref:Uncharacterized protein n=1 Tax=Neofusicoccum ribis TaxID=45134 RepID=A0ABR3SUV6_9PEZI